MRYIRYKKTKRRSLDYARDDNAKGVISTKVEKSPLFLTPFSPLLLICLAIEDNYVI